MPTKIATRITSLIVWLMAFLSTAVVDAGTALVLRELPTSLGART